MSRAWDGAQRPRTPEGPVSDWLYRLCSPVSAECLPGHLFFGLNDSVLEWGNLQKGGVSIRLIRVEHYSVLSIQLHGCRVNLPRPGTASMLSVEDPLDGDGSQRATRAQSNNPLSQGLQFCPNAAQATLMTPNGAAPIAMYRCAWDYGWAYTMQMNGVAGLVTVVSCRCCCWGLMCHWGYGVYQDIEASGCLLLQLLQVKVCDIVQPPPGLIWGRQIQSEWRGKEGQDVFCSRSPLAFRDGCERLES